MPLLIPIRQASEVVSWVQGSEKSFILSADWLIEYIGQTASEVSRWRIQALFRSILYRVYPAAEFEKCNKCVSHYYLLARRNLPPYQRVVSWGAVHLGYRRDGGVQRSILRKIAAKALENWSETTTLAALAGVRQLIDWRIKLRRVMRQKKRATPVGSPVLLIAPACRSSEFDVHTTRVIIPRCAMPGRFPGLQSNYSS